MRTCCQIYKALAEGIALIESQKLTDLSNTLPAYMLAPSIEVVKGLTNFCAVCGTSYLTGKRLVESTEPVVKDKVRKDPEIKEVKVLRCGICNGTGYVDKLSRQHDDPNVAKCMYCHGKGVRDSSNIPTAPVPEGAINKAVSLKEQIIRENKPVRDTVKELEEDLNKGQDDEV
jgi:hypothetical protein